MVVFLCLSSVAQASPASAARLGNAARHHDGERWRCDGPRGKAEASQLVAAVRRDQNVHAGLCYLPSPVSNLLSNDNNQKQSRGVSRMAGLSLAVLLTCSSTVVVEEPLPIPSDQNVSGSWTVATAQRWHSPSGHLDPSGLGTGIAWTEEYRFCDLLQRRFASESLQLFGSLLFTFVDCDEIADTIVRAFAGNLAPPPATHPTPTPAPTPPPPCLLPQYGRPTQKSSPSIACPTSAPSTRRTPPTIAAGQRSAARATGCTAPPHLRTSAPSAGDLEHGYHEQRPAGASDPRDERRGAAL